MNREYARREFPYEGYLDLSVTISDGRGLVTGDHYTRKGRTWVGVVVGWPDRSVNVLAKGNGSFGVECSTHPDTSVVVRGFFGPSGVSAVIQERPTVDVGTGSEPDVAGGMVRCDRRRPSVSGFIVTDRTRTSSGIGPQVTDRNLVEVGFADRSRSTWFNVALYVTGDLFVGMPGVGQTLVGRLDRTGLVMDRLDHPLAGPS